MSAFRQAMDLEIERIEWEIAFEFYMEAYAMLVGFPPSRARAWAMVVAGRHGFR